jgi:DNA-binding transcriptional ArsR family regulator
MVKTQDRLTEMKAEILTAIAHPNRIKILEYLQKGVYCNCELAPAIGLEQSNLSRHLKILTKAGVLISWKEGLKVNFKVADPKVFKILEYAESLARTEVESTLELLEQF